MSVAFEKVREIIGPILAEEGLLLWDSEWVTENGRRLLRITVEKEGGQISLDDCARFSHAIEDVLEVNEVIPGPYVLEVSSPGLERVLKTREHFLCYIGREIRVKMREGMRRNYKGILRDVSHDSIVVEVDGTLCTLSLVMIARAHLIFGG